MVDDARKYLDQLGDTTSIDPVDIRGGSTSDSNDNSEDNSSDNSDDDLGDNTDNGSLDNGDGSEE